MGCNCNKKKTPFFEEASISSTGISSIKSITGDKFTPFVTPEEQNTRLSICKDCPYHIIVLDKDRCNAGDGSFLRAKTSLRDQQCQHPEGPKW